MKLIREDLLPWIKGITLTTMQLRRLQAAGKFPLPVQMQERGTRFYPESEIDAYLVRLAEQRGRASSAS